MNLSGCFSIVVCVMSLDDRCSAVVSVAASIVKVMSLSGCCCSVLVSDIQYFIL